MGKRSDFERVERDFYPTPYEAVKPLLQHIGDVVRYCEPCAGDGALVEHLYSHGLRSGLCSDIDPKEDWIIERNFLNITHDDISDCSHIITNPPWDRKILHPMIRHFAPMKPTWLLFDADWMHTRQSAEFMPWLVKVVSVGRVKWIPGSKMTGKDNCAWYLFDAWHSGATEFVGRR